MYWVYENWQAGPHKVVLHHETCGMCKRGQGLRGGTNPAFGKWHGPFTSVQEARSFSSTAAAKVTAEHSCV